MGERMMRMMAEEPSQEEDDDVPMKQIIPRQIHLQVCRDIRW